MARKTGQGPQWTSHSRGLTQLTSGQVRCSTLRFPGSALKIFIWGRSDGLAPVSAYPHQGRNPLTQSRGNRTELMSGMCSGRASSEKNRLCFFRGTASRIPTRLTSVFRRPTAVNFHTVSQLEFPVEPYRPTVAYQVTFHRKPSYNARRAVAGKPSRPTVAYQVKLHRKPSYNARRAVAGNPSRLPTRLHSQLP